MLVIPTIAAPSQTLSVVLANQACRINIYQKTQGMFVDLYVNDVLIVGGSLCLDTMLIVHDAYLGFIGDLTFLDTQGSDDPQASGLGTRWLFVYIEAGELLVMSGTQFVQRVINVTLSIGLGVNGEAGTETTTFYGARVLAQIEKTGMPGASYANLRIFGLSLDHMNKISTLGMEAFRTRKNTVLVSAGDAINGMGTVFSGVIFEAFADFNAMPDVTFTIDAHPLLIDQLKPIPPTSFNGPVDVAVVLAGLATQMNYRLENNGVSVIIPNAYYWGTAIDQARAVAQAANIYLYFDDTTQRMAIWPRDGNRGGVVPLISPATGMVGYPSFVSNGLGFRVLYNPSLVFGALIKIDSSIPAARGYWIVNRLSHRLESQEPGGAWFSDVEAYRLGNTNPNVNR